MRSTEYVSKAGMNGLTKALTLRLGPEITVNGICPGRIRTDMVEEIDPAVQHRILEETAWEVGDARGHRWRGHLPRFFGRGLHRRRDAHRGW